MKVVDNDDCAWRPQAGKWSEAHEAYSAAVAGAPSSHLPLANRAMAALKLRDFAAAEADCTSAIALEPTYLKVTAAAAAILCSDLASCTAGHAGQQESSGSIVTGLHCRVHGGYTSYPCQLGMTCLKHNRCGA